MCHVVVDELARLGQIPFGDLSDGLSQLLNVDGNLPVLGIHLTRGIYVVEQNLSLLRSALLLLVGLPDGFLSSGQR